MIKRSSYRDRHNYQHRSTRIYQSYIHIHTMYLSLKVKQISSAYTIFN